MKQKIYIFSLLFIPVFFSCTKNNIPYTQDGDWIAAPNSTALREVKHWNLQLAILPFLVPDGTD